MGWIFILVLGLSGCVASENDGSGGPSGPADGLSVEQQQMYYSYLDNRTHPAIQCVTAAGQTPVEVTFNGRSGACAGRKQLSYLDGDAYWACLPSNVADINAQYAYEKGIFSWSCGEYTLAGPIGLDSPQSDSWGELIVTSTFKGYLYLATCGSDFEPTDITCRAFPDSQENGAARYESRARWANAGQRQARWCGELIAATNLGYAEDWGQRATNCTLVEAECFAARDAVNAGTEVPASNTCR